ncbi:MAG: hypothetical protein EP343_20835 [Deltaproteobacteria bacterium]|nr:MAG: hypothetical protein EP343_20835 [Deltaproteobacteria bacterium]
MHQRLLFFGFCLFGFWVSWHAPALGETPTTQRAGKGKPTPSSTTRPLSKAQRLRRGKLFEFYKQQKLEMFLHQAKLHLHQFPSDGVVWFLVARVRFRKYGIKPFRAGKMGSVLEALENALAFSTANSKVPLLYRKGEQPLQWEAYFLKGRVFQRLIQQSYLRYRRKLASNSGDKYPPKFVPNSTWFQKSKAAYQKAAALPQTNRWKRVLPFLQVSMLHALYRREYLKAVAWMRKAEALDDANLNVVGNLKMLYDRLKEDAEKRGDKKDARRYEKLSILYDSKMAALRGARP